MSEPVGMRMAKVRNRVTLQPETVTKAEKLAKKSPPRRKKAEPSPPAVKRRYLKKPPGVSSMAWDAALKLSHNEPRRLDVVDDITIVVTNNA